jgi:hypothetical protein
VRIPHDEWSEASGKLVEDDDGKLWRIIGFIDQPTVILDPVMIHGETDLRTRAYEVMGSLNSKRFHRLVRTPTPETSNG